MFGKRESKTTKIILLLGFLLTSFFLLTKVNNVSACRTSCDFPSCCGECPCLPTPTEIPSPSPTPQEPTPTSYEPSPTLEPTPIPTTLPSDKKEIGGPVGAPVCGAETPKPPFLVSAVSIGGNKVELKWQKPEKATHYTISYGPKSGDYPWGVPNTGETDHFTVEGLSSGCFVVRAVNDCAPSEPSNEVCTGVGQVLGLSTTSGGNTTHPLVFFLGLASLLVGTKSLANQLSKKRP